MKKKAAILKASHLYWLVVVLLPICTPLSEFDLLLDHQKNGEFEESLGYTARSRLKQENLPQLEVYKQEDFPNCLSVFILFWCLLLFNLLAARYCKCLRKHFFKWVNKAIYLVCYLGLFLHLLEASFSPVLLDASPVGLQLFPEHNQFPGLIHLTSWSFSDIPTSYIHLVPTNLYNKASQGQVLYQHWSWNVWR